MSVYVYMAYMGDPMSIPLSSTSPQRNGLQSKDGKFVAQVQDQVEAVLYVFSYLYVCVYVLFLYVTVYVVSHIGF